MRRLPLYPKVRYHQSHLLTCVGRNLILLCVLILGYAAWRIWGRNSWMVVHILLQALCTLIWPSLIHKSTCLINCFSLVWGGWLEVSPPLSVVSCFRLAWGQARGKHGGGWRSIQPLLLNSRVEVPMQMPSKLVRAYQTSEHATQMCVNTVSYTHLTLPTNREV